MNNLIKISVVLIIVSFFLIGNNIFPNWLAETAIQRKNCGYGGLIFGVVGIFLFYAGSIQEGIKKTKISKKIS